MADCECIPAKDVMYYDVEMWTALNVICVLAILSQSTAATTQCVITDGRQLIFVPPV